MYTPTQIENYTNFLSNHEIVDHKQLLNSIGYYLSRTTGDKIKDSFFLKVNDLLNGLTLLAEDEGWICSVQLAETLVMATSLANTIRRTPNQFREPVFYTTVRNMGKGLVEVSESDWI